MPSEAVRSPTIVLGVTGGIAAYKSAELVRLLTERGYRVRVVMTEHAQRFISPLTFAALSGERVITGLFSDSGGDATLQSAIEHIGVAQAADVLLVAPATADLLAKFAQGLADDFLTTTYLAYRGPVIVAPAMNSNMWNHAATRQNTDTLRLRGVHVVAPEEGDLACGMVGPGRLAALEKIVAAVEQALEPRRDLAGESVLITAGPTQEPLDPVRFLSNRSSGKMGFALAEEALSRGARVTLISGPVALRPPPGCELVAVQTAAQMHRAVLQHLPGSTIVVMAAAVADYTPATSEDQKIKKQAAARTLELQPTADILSDVAGQKGDRLLIGFAAETEDLRRNAEHKLRAKNCDLVVANLVGPAANRAGFESEENEGWLFSSSGEAIELPRSPKREMAGRIFDQVVRLAPALRRSAGHGRSRRTVPSAAK